MYKINDYVIYRHNVCMIKDIKENARLGKEYYVMNPVFDTSLTIDVPVENKMGLLRDVIDSYTAKELIKNIVNIEPLSDVNERYLEAKYKELLNNGSHESLIKIIKTTYLRNKNRINNKKKISEKDNDYFNLAEKYLYNELSISLDMTVQEVKDYIFKVVNNEK